MNRLTLLLLTTMLSSTELLFAWPTAQQWIPIYRGGAFIQDDNGDTNGSRNIVSDATHAAAFIYNDGTYMYFRQRLDDSPQGTGGQLLLKSFGWGLEFDTDQDATNYEWLIMVDGIGVEGIHLWQNTTQGTVNDPGDHSEVLNTTISLTGNHQISQADTSFNNDQDYFLDWRFPYATFKQATGLTDSSLIRVFEGSSSSTNTLTENGADLAGPNDLSAGFSDFLTPLGIGPSTGTVKFVEDLSGNGDLTVILPGDTVYVRVIDSDRNFDFGVAQTLTVTVTTSNGESETVTLTETGASTGVFTGSIDSVQGTVSTGDGVLSIARGDAVTVTYVDAIDADLNLNQNRTDTLAAIGPIVVLTKQTEKANALPGEEIVYTITYQNTASTTSHNVVTSDDVPAFTSYVSGSLKMGGAGSTYATATTKTDVAGDDEATIDAGTITFTIPLVGADDGTAGSGSDEGKLYFKVTVD